MRGYRFYEELEKKNRKGEKSKGTVVALILDQGPGRRWTPLYIPPSRDQPICAECVSAVFDRPNSPVASGGVALSYLWGKCRRISEARAREIHPALFEYLEG
jgi:hypothetical protein